MSNHKEEDCIEMPTNGEVVTSDESSNFTYAPKMKESDGKERISLVPIDIIKNIAKTREWGITKYPDDTWRDSPVEVFIDAMLRHTLEYMRDPHSVDPESGLPHSYHAVTNWAFIMELSNANDDVTLVSLIKKLHNR